MAEELQKTVVSQKELAGFHPSHASYVYAQNQVSVMSEQLTGLKEMAPFVDIISKAEDLYIPSAPPMSSLTTSYFTCWAFFDACAGTANETIGTTILEVGRAFGMHPELLRVMRLMQDSRMGFYIHRAQKATSASLRISSRRWYTAQSFRQATKARRTRTGTSVCFRRRYLDPRSIWSSRRRTS
jgi:hypothetical protein